MKRTRLLRKTPLMRSKVSFKRRKPIRRVSKAKARKDSVYRLLRVNFLRQPENRFCIVMKTLQNQFISTDQVHHMLSRYGKNYLDTSTWLAVSAEGHRWIESHLKEARERGWLGNKHTGVIGGNAGNCQNVEFFNPHSD